LAFAKAFHDLALYGFDNLGKQDGSQFENGTGVWIRLLNTGEE